MNRPSTGSGIAIPKQLLPSDGRFGSGPSKIRPEAVDDLCSMAGGFLGTSHRQSGVHSVIGRLKEGLRSLFDLPDGYEVVLGNGGTSVLWDALCFSLIAKRSQHVVFGQFSAKFAEAAALAAHLEEPEIVPYELGAAGRPRPSPGVDVYALTHNETSTGVVAPIERTAPEALVAVDATSGAGGLRVDVSETDVYYFSPQKCFASEGGLWIALCSPQALERVSEIAASDRYLPPSLDLHVALESSRKNETYNTPALSTLLLMVLQIEWMLSNGGLEWATARCDRSAAILYGWAERSALATPFVRDPAFRSSVVATIDFDERADAAELALILRSNGIVDTEPYRRLRRNQLRIGLYPAVEPDDVAMLTESIDYVLEAIVS